LGARWHLREIRYHVPPAVLVRLAAAGIDTETAVTHLNQVVKEFGIFIDVDKTGSLEEAPYQRTIVDDIPPMPLRETRDLNLALLGVGLGGEPPPPRVDPALDAARLQGSQAQQSLAAAQAEIAALRAEITALRSSRTWRTMEPVRWLSGAVRGLTNGAGRAP
jgi:hypothetical protein